MSVWSSNEADLPRGGSAGQILVKSSNNDYAVTWQTPTSGT